MTSETIRNYFLRAGASFRESSDWAFEFIDDEGRTRVPRAGRFGVGAFAVFLLGPTLRLWTRHVAADESQGYTVQVGSQTRLVEIRRASNIPIGTTLEVDLSDETISALELDVVEEAWIKSTVDTKTDWFCWDWPRVERRVIRNGKTAELPQDVTAPLRKGQRPEWSVIYPRGFDAVFWSFRRQPILSCNGITITNPRYPGIDDRFDWPETTQLERPCVAVVDSAGNLPLTVQRYGLSQQRLPFTDDLVRDVLVSFIAHAIVCGPTAPLSRHPKGHDCRYPLAPSRFSEYERTQGKSSNWLSRGLLRWCATDSECVPADPWLYSLLKNRSCLVYGVLDSNNPGSNGFMRIVFKEAFDSISLSWDGVLSHITGLNSAGTGASKFLKHLCKSGVTALGHNILGVRVLVSAKSNVELRAPHYLRGHVITSGRSQRRWQLLQSGIEVGTLDLNELMDEIEQQAEAEAKTSRFYFEPALYYVSEVTADVKECNPESSLAMVWNEFLGAKTIPFDLGARNELIIRARKNPELGRHIKAWETMKRNGSRWVEDCR